MMILLTSKILKNLIERFCQNMSLLNVFKIFYLLFFTIVSGCSTDMYKEEVDQKMLSDSRSCCLLELVDCNHPSLNKSTQWVTFPLSEKNQQLIDDMMFSIQPEQLKQANAPWSQAAGMAANQWGSNRKIFVYCPDDGHNYDVVINPMYEVHEHSIKELGWEGCFSVPLTLGYVDRFTHIVATYQNEQGVLITKELKDWPARVFQHETDHLNGILFKDPQDSKHSNIHKCSEIKTFSSEDEATNFLKEKRTESHQANSDHQ